MFCIVLGRCGSSALSDSASWSLACLSQSTLTRCHVYVLRMRSFRMPSAKYGPTQIQACTGARNLARRAVSAGCLCGSCALCARPLPMCLCRRACCAPCACAPKAIRRSHLPVQRLNRQAGAAPLRERPAEPCSRASTAARGPRQAGAGAEQSKTKDRQARRFICRGAGVQGPGRVKARQQRLLSV